MHMYFRTETYIYIVEMLILPKCSVCTCILVMPQIAYLEFRITRSGFSIPLDFDISRLHCICEVKKVMPTLVLGWCKFFLFSYR